MIVDCVHEIGVVATASSDNCTGALAKASALTLAALRGSSITPPTFSPPPTQPACP